MNPIRLTVTLAAALLPAALSVPTASAADIQVSYRIDAKALKSGTPAGTPLSFQLFTDSTCVTSAGTAQVVNVETVTLIGQPKLIRVKGGPRPPSVAEPEDRSSHLRGSVSSVAGSARQDGEPGEMV